MSESEDHEGETVSVVPMIELLLVLLLYFVVVDASAGQSPVPLPSDGPVTESVAHKFRVVVDRNGDLSDGERVCSAEELGERIRREQPASILIQAHKDAPFHHVMTARRVCWNAGVRRLGEEVQNP